MTDDRGLNPFSPSSVPPTREPPPDSKHTMRQCAQTSSLMTLAMASGLTVITGTLLFLIFSKKPVFADLIAFGKEGWVLLVVGGMVMLASLVARAIVPPLVRRHAISNFSQSEGGQLTSVPGVEDRFPGSRLLLGGFQTAHIVQLALLEGFAVINAIFMFTSSCLLHLIPVMFSIVAMLLTMPTIDRVDQFVREAIDWDEPERNG